MIVMGMISGTSRDGIDVATVELEPDDDEQGRPGLRGRLLVATTVPYDPDLAAALERAMTEPATTWLEVCRLDAAIGRAFADAATAAVAEHGPVDAVCSHGQTLYHWVEDGQAQGTLQLGNPSWIAEAVGAPVVADTRSSDLAAGGHGAPLVPVLDLLALPRLGSEVAALNLGGIANITVLGPRIAYDTGPANSLLDTAVRLRGAHPSGFDAGGAIAATGAVDADLLADLLAHPYFAADAPKSTGPETFGPAWLEEMLAAHPDVTTPDLLATLTVLTARTVAAELRRWDVERVVASGGGVHNHHLMRCLRAELPEVAVETADVIGLPGDAKEAIAFALIGWLTLHGLPGNVTTCTGASDPRVLGVIAAGAGPLELPARQPMPQWLVMR